MPLILHRARFRHLGYPNIRSETAEKNSVKPNVALHAPELQVILMPLPAAVTLVVNSISWVVAVEILEGRYIQTQ